MSKVLSLRVPDEIAEWVESYAEKRGVTRMALLEEGLRSFMEDCERGVPEIRQRAREQSAVKTQAGVGECAKSKKGHVWEMVGGDRKCRFCGKSGRAFLAENGLARAEMFSRLRPSMTSGSKTKESA